MRRRRPIRRRRRRRRAKGSAGTQALKLVRKMQRNVEVKEYTSTFTFTRNSATALQLHYDDMLSHIAGGDSKNEREGNKITIKSLACRINLIANDKSSPSGATQGQYRLVLIWDRRPNGLTTLPTWQTIFDGTGNMYDLLSTDEETRGRFQILFDKVYNYTSDVGHGLKTIKYYKRFNLPVFYNETLATRSSVQKGNFYWYLLRQESGTIAAEDVAIINYRLRYTDM
jgi:hypothetical protein